MENKTAGSQKCTYPNALCLSVCLFVSLSDSLSVSVSLFVSLFFFGGGGGTHVLYPLGKSGARRVQSLENTYRLGVQSTSAGRIVSVHHLHHVAAPA